MAAHTGRERMGSPTLQTLQEPVLLLALLLLARLGYTTLPGSLWHVAGRSEGPSIHRIVYGPVTGSTPRETRRLQETPGVMASTPPPSVEAARPRGRPIHPHIGAYHSHVASMEDANLRTRTTWELTGVEAVLPRLCGLESNTTFHGAAYILRPPERRT